MNKADQFERRLKEAVQEEVFPGCSFLYMDDEEEIVLSLGRATYDTKSFPISNDTLFDTASLTKIVATMTLASLLIDEGVISLDDKIDKYLSEYGSSAEKRSASILHLMTYTLNYNIPNGSKALMPGLSSIEIAHNAMSFLLNEIPGKSYVYSNLTAFILTQVIEKATGRSFYSLVEEKIFGPLNMITATFSPKEDQIPLIPPTEITDERGVVQGVVHDEFTYYTKRGGIANGASGLFASIKDIKMFLQLVLNRGVVGNKEFISEALTSKWTHDHFPELLPTHTPLAWGDRNNPMIDSFHRDIVVKSGFTGCFMLADLKQKRAFAILSNRTYPVRPADSVHFNNLKEDLTTFALG
jgi:CubicO group peptidase (beta-lactamase class C family)